MVDRLQFYIDYFKKTEYFLQDIYGQVPFKVTIDKDKNQLFDQFIKVKMVSNNSYQITIPFQANTAEVIRYIDNKKSIIPIDNVDFKEVYKIENTSMVQSGTK